MSEPGDPTVAMAYDPIELRRRIAVCFSGPELRALADSLGVTGSIAWDRGTQEAVRDLVRQFERYYGLPLLVEKLRELRPLVEWPEAQPAGSIGSPFEGGAPPPLSSQGTFGAPPPLSSQGTFGAPPPPFSPLAPRAARPAAPQEDQEEPVLADPMLPLESGAPRSFGGVAPSRRAEAAWPGVTGAQTPPSRALGADVRVLIGVVALAALAAVIAFVAGRASTPPSGQEAVATSAAPASPSDPRGKRPDGPATRAAAAFSRALTAIGRVCELPPGVATTPEILVRANDQCGPAPLLRAPRTWPLPDTAPSAATPAARDDEPARSRPPRGGAAAPDLPAAPGGSCIHACDATHAACKAGCGSEPTESSQYDGYQRCRGSCLAAQSRCRIGCK